MTLNINIPDKCTLKQRNSVRYVSVEKCSETDHYKFTYHTGAVSYFDKYVVLNLLEWLYDIVPQEPDLVFPFTYESSEQPYGHYEVTKDEKGDTWWRCLKSDWTSSIPSLYTNENIKRLIKAGTWIIKSVGEPKKNVWESVVGSLKASKAPTSDVSKLTIEVDSSQVKEATEAFKELAIQVGNVNMSLEHMQQLMQEMGLSSKSEQCVVECDSRAQKNQSPTSTQLYQLYCQRKVRID